MRKKVALSIAAAAMVGTLAVGGTLAWFTDTETATNVVTMGNVDIAMNETGEGDGIIGENGLNYDDLMPGNQYKKSVDIYNEGNEAYVRAIITVSSDSTKVIDSFMADGLKIVGLGDDITWTEAENGKSASTTLNYSGVFEENASWHLFDGFEVPNTWGNEFENATFNIKVDAQAIQADNVEEDSAWDNFTADEGNKPVDETGAVDSIATF